MIALDGVSMRFRTGGRETVVADRIRAVFPTGRAVALLGRNGAGKSTLLRIIAGTMRPSAGRVRSDGTVSWPVGFGGAFHPDMTGAQNARFIARVYGVDTGGMLDYVEDFARLGDKLYQPVRGYSAGMRARLAFATSMAVRFDTYLVDEVTAVGDADFRARSEAVLGARMRAASAIVVSHSMPLLRRLCDAGAVLEDGQLRYFDDLDAAIALHQRQMAVA
ncbi:ABC transporter ATP-binding protein [Jannaschia ovalis]|uniref:ABC transporter ATP-binding protein n=1 Tax=Jannaschia ovalis TaxID=3038773 RepID=A0ABY8LJ51_9RHOB|nr:ABC transporter ATP-binding protein [Jannaschia sp. GRR-S6-38]WGH80219.1 ABC transporter ATP-binding protein [Jannaschia sp. GRR-S6-38]